MESNVYTIYNLLKGFLGCGNPRGKLWFIGMEEKWLQGSPLMQENSYYENPIASFTNEVKESFIQDSRKQNTFYFGVIRIIQILFPQNDPLEIVFNDCFLTNIKILPRDNKRETPEGFNRFLKDKSKIEKDEIDRRVKLFQLWETNFPGKRSTFCLGSDPYYKDFVKMFSLEPKEDINYYWNKFENPFKNNVNNLIYFMYHPTSRKSEFRNSLSKLQQVIIK